jgi:hypothetical protein
VFQLRFGRAREAVALWQEGLEILRRAGVKDARLLTDLTGPYYTLVLETAHENVADFDASIHAEMADEEWRAWYARFVPLVEGGRREMFTVVGSQVPPLPTAAGRARAGTRGN